jgi:hypothetical protein
MRTIDKPHYECEHCNKKYFSKGWCKRHEEKMCSSNPKNYDKCTNCKHSVSGTEVMDFVDYYGVEYTKTVNVYSCDKLKKETYPFKAASKNLPNRFPETFEGKIQMPNECEHFESEDLDGFFNRISKLKL